MSVEEKYFSANKNQWNERTKIHVDSKFYDNKSFLKGRSSLNSIELEELGNVKGKSLLHLQCHFGQDTLSWNRMGAKTVGVDLSDEAIKNAEKINAELGLDSKFICCNVYDLKEHLDEKFDLVFTSYGTIGWLPDINKWAEIVSYFLKPGGTFLIVDFHPYIWIYDDNFEFIKYSYFHENEPIAEIVESTYTGGDKVGGLKSFSWNHPISDITNALIQNGLKIIGLNEYNYSPYNCFSEMDEIEKGKFVINNLGEKVPHLYSIKATKELS